MNDQTDLREAVHDLRNRLSAIVTAANAMKKSQFEQKFANEMIDVIQANVERANATLNDLSTRQDDLTD